MQLAPSTRLVQLGLEDLVDDHQQQSSLFLKEEEDVAVRAAVGRLSTQENTNNVKLTKRPLFALTLLGLSSLMYLFMIGRSVSISNASTNTRVEKTSDAKKNETFVATPIYPPSKQAPLNQTHTRSEEEPCAILFFGLIKSFEKLVLPTIQRNIIDVNPNCHIFLHTYNLTNIPVNSRNGENDTSYELNASEVFLLTENVTLSHGIGMGGRRKNTLARVRKYVPGDWGECCTASDNMVKQWHSIAAVWDLMQSHERRSMMTIHPWC